MDWLNNLMAQQEALAQQQEIMNYNMMIQNQQLMGTQMRKTTKRDILMYLQQLSQSNDIVQVDEFETLRTRHICKGSKEITVLEKGVQPVPTSEGYINVEYFLCPKCRKLILNKTSLSMI